MPIHPKIKTFLWFEANAEAAVQFYTSIFKAHRELACARVVHTDATIRKQWRRRLEVSILEEES